MRIPAQNWLTKLALIFPLIIFFFLFLKVPVFAATNVAAPQTVQPPSQYLTPNTNPDVPKNMHTYTQSIVIELLSSAVCQLSGVDPISKDHKCLGIDPQTGKIGFVENGGGAVGVMGNLIAATFVPPTSSSEYFKYMARNFGFPKKAYAAPDCSANNSTPNGYGFCVLEPLTNFWIAMRNIVYLLFTVIFIIIGMAIMLRIHIDPRTVMTIENQIPKIIVGILLVSFSLAIAGLLIDVMYVSIYVIGNVLTGITGSELDKSVYSQAATASNPFQALGIISGGTNGGFFGITGNVAGAITQVIGTVISFPFSDVIIGIITGIIVFIALLYALLRVWITLIMAYITILLDVVFAPFWFLGGLLPGATIGIGAWFRDMIANLAVFPATIAMFALALIFSNLGGGLQGGPSEQIFNPPLVGALGTSTLGGLIMFGFIFMTPQVLTVMKAAIKAPKLNFGPVFQPITVAGGIVGGAPRRVGGGLIHEVTRVKYGEEKKANAFQTAGRIFFGGRR